MDPENLVLALTRLRDFVVEREVKDLSLPVYDQNRGRLHPPELYALIHVIFSDTNLQVYLKKKKYRLSLGCIQEGGILNVGCVCYVMLCYILCY